MTKLWCLIATMIEFKYLNDIRPVFLRNITSITSSLFLISKCSRITSLQSLFFNFLESNVFVKFRSVYELFSCKQGNKGFLVFTYQVSPCRDGLRCTYSFSGVPSTVLTLCAWHLGKGALTPIIGASRFTSFP